jgi:hypothetical protein
VRLSLAIGVLVVWTGVASAWLQAIYSPAAVSAGACRVLIYVMPTCLFFGMASAAVVWCAMRLLREPPPRLCPKIACLSTDVACAPTLPLLNKK